MRLDKPYSQKQYAGLAVFCNANNCHVEDKGEYLESVENPPYVPTVEDNIASLKAKLSASDYIGNKLAEALTDEERQALLIEYNELIQLRRQWRIEINAFEATSASPVMEL